MSLQKGRPKKKVLQSPDELSQAVDIVQGLVSQYRLCLKQNVKLDPILESALREFQGIIPALNNAAWLTPGTTEAVMLKALVEDARLAYVAAKKGSLSRTEVFKLICAHLSVSDTDTADEWRTIILREAKSSAALKLENSPAHLARELVSRLFSISPRTLEKRRAKSNLK